MGAQRCRHLRSTQTATSKIRQLMEWTRRTVPPILQEAKQDISSELKANHTAKPIVASCARKAALTNEMDLLCFISNDPTLEVTLRMEPRSARFQTIGWTSLLDDRVSPIDATHRTYTHQ
jgi:hypothetical protein